MRAAGLRTAAAFALVGVAAACAGCGLGAGDGVAGVSLTVTRNHGDRVLLDRPYPKVSGDDTVLRLLQRNTTVGTQYGGAFVSSIAGVKGGSDGDWFFWVDGVAADRGAASWRLRSGERVWWDRGVAAAALGETPAVVGSFPAPLVGGFDGRSPTVALRCAAPPGRACGLVRERLKAVGAHLATTAQIALPRTDRAAPVEVVVATAAELRDDGAEGGALLAGPGRSGVFVRAAPRRGGALQVLDPSGHPVRELGPGEGLVAATRLDPRAPVWFLTGSDDLGLRRAAKALTAGTLAHHLAVSVDADGAAAVPEAGR